jgi:hypothetical protein
MTTFDPAAYGPVLADLLRAAPVNPLDAGRPVGALRPKLVALGDDAFPEPVRDPGMAKACRAGLWLRFNYLDESHRISQDLSTAAGSFWHGVMHRREGDFENAKYWFRRVGTHPVFDPLGRDAAALAAAADPSGVFLPAQGAWDPFAFVDLCEASLAGRSPRRELCEQVQQREWELLFDHCVRHAVGGR